MFTRSRILFSTLVLTALLLPVGGAALAASPHARAAHRSGQSMATLTIAITMTSGTVWGTVTARYTVHHKTVSHSCSLQQCSLRIPKGAKVHLTQTPTNSTSWPFQKWQIQKAHSASMKTTTASSLRLKLTGAEMITAVYVLSQPPYYSHRA